MTVDQQNFDLDEAATTQDAASNAERNRVREIYRARLAEKLKDPEFRKIEGFPIGTDEAILALSDPPFYTACPNPFLEEWLAENATPYDASTDDYHREPFAADVSEGKNDPIYNAHSYHTKVPHKAIMRYILHYTEPGDVVYDGFCGTGMTGVAAQMCGNKAQVESLGYTVRADGAILDADGQQISRFGARKAILNDLSPAATFIAFNYNTPVNAAAFEREAKRILAEVEAECGWMYTTLHEASEAETERVAGAVRTCSTAEELRQLYEGLKSPCSPLRDAKSRLQVGKINYTVWSDVFLCPQCSGEIIFFTTAIDKKTSQVLDDFPCPSCAATLKKRDLDRHIHTTFDRTTGAVVTQAVQRPVLVNYNVATQRVSKDSDLADLALVGVIEAFRITHFFPTARIDRDIDMWYERDYRSLGIYSLDAFFTHRNLSSLGELNHAIMCLADQSLRLACLFSLTAIMQISSRMSSFRYDARNPANTAGGILKGALYIPSLSKEARITELFARKISQLRSIWNDSRRQSPFLISTQSTTLMEDPLKECADYIFIDPPFGSNIIYSDLSLIWEAWLQVTTATDLEAVVHRRKKINPTTLEQYQALMAQGFSRCYRMLKPGRWMTVEFSNSSNAVWNSIQESLVRAGFVVADIRVLDKMQGSFKQVTTFAAVKEDLVISCYKPRAEFEERFQEIKGRPEGVLEFVRQHLSMLPIAPLTKEGKLESIAERTRFLLFDRMIAYHLQRGAPIPINSADFYKLLEDQFTTRDEMYFLPDQAARYDALKSRGYETEQLSIFLQDEKTAVQWVRAALTETPQTLGDLAPKFMQELREWPKHEPRPELRDLLREYFIHGDGGVWRVPNPDDEKDIEALRKSAMLRLFQGYTREKGALKTFRKEAVMEGFKQCYETKQYGVIVAICEKIPAKVFQEIAEFVMFYDIAKDLAPEQVEQTEFVWE